MAESKAFIAKAMKQTEVRPVPRSPSQYHYVFTQNQLGLNDKYLSHSFSQSPNFYVYSNISDSEPPKDEAIDETNDIVKFENQISEDGIKEFLLQKDIEKNAFNKISSVFAVNKFSQRPGALIMPKKPGNFIKLSLKSCQINLDGIPDGYFALFNTKEMKIASIPIPFEVESQDKLIFPHSKDNSVYFPVSEFSSDLQLLCFINAVDADTFGLKTLFALNLLPLFNEEKKFVAHSKFVTPFIQANKSSFEESLKKLVSREDVKELDIGIDFITAQITDELNTKSYIWSLNQGQNLCSWEIPRNPTFPLPIITLSNITAMFKDMPKHQAYQMKVYLFDSAKQRGCSPGIAKLLSPSTPSLVDVYQSPLMQAAETMNYPDFIHILVDRDISIDSHVVVHFLQFGLDKNMKPLNANGSITWMAIIPIFLDGIPQTKNTCVVALNQTDKLSNNYLKKLPTTDATKKPYLSFDINIPHAFILHPDVRDFKSSKITHPEIEVLKENMIPLTENLISNEDAKCPKQLFDLYSRFTRQDINSIMIPWIYHSYDPSAIVPAPSSVDRITKTFLPFIKENLAKASCIIPSDTVTTEKGLSSDEVQLQNFLKRSMKALPILFHFLIVSVSTPGLNWDKKQLVDLLLTIPKIICLNNELNREFPASLPTKNKKEFIRQPPIPRNLEQEFINTDIISFVDTFALVIQTILPFVDPKFNNHIIMEFYKCVSETESKSNEPLNLLYLQIIFFKRLALSKLFIINSITPCRKDAFNDKLAAYQPVMSSFLKIIFSCFLSQNITLIQSASIFLSRFFIAIESAPESLCNHVAIVMIPVVPLIYEIFHSSLIKSNPDIQINFIVPISFIFGAASKELSFFFASLDENSQKNFLIFLKSITNLIVSHVSSANKDQSKQFTQKLFFNFTKTILIYLIGSYEHFNKCFNNVIDLLSVMASYFQPPQNLPLFFELIQKLTTKYNNYNVVIRWLLQLVMFKQHSVRCFAAAALLQIFSADFEKTGSINLSSVETLDAYTNHVMQTEDGKIDIFKLFMSRVAAVAPVLNKNSLSELVNERVKASNVVAECIIEQRTSKLPLDILCRNVMRIADQYFNFPSMRHKWLLQIVDYNKKANDYISAFVAQLHVVTLIASIIEFKHVGKDVPIKDHSLNLRITQPRRMADIREKSGHIFVKNDFSFFPDVLKEISVEYEESTKDSALLSDYNFEMLIRAIEVAVNFGREAGLFYNLRPLYSLMLRVHHTNRDTKGASQVYSQYAKDEAKIESLLGKILNRMHFYYVEDRCGEINKQVFCSSLALTEFVASLTNRFQENPHECRSHSSKNCKDKGVCVVELEPVYENTGTEYQHSFTSFKSIVNLNQYQVTDAKSQIIEQLNVKTVDHLPHYRMSVDVNTVKTVDIKFLKYIETVIDHFSKAMDSCSAEFEVFYQEKMTKQIVSTAIIEPNIKRIQHIFDALFKDQFSIGNIIIELAQYHPEETKQMVSKLVNPMTRLMNIYIRAISDYSSPELAQAQSYLNNFVTKVGIGPLQMLPFVGMTNPMDVQCDFVEFSGVTSEPPSIESSAPSTQL